MKAVRNSLSAILSSACTTATIAVLAAATAASPLAAQSPQLLAFYPLVADLLDATNQNGPAVLYGTPPPAPPSNGECLNGIYYYNTGGQDIRTPVFNSLNTNDCEIDVEFYINGFQPYNAPVLMGGHLWRWLGIYLTPNGTVGIKYNNSNLAWSSTTLSLGNWYSASLKCQNGTALLYINSTLVLSATVGMIVDGNNKNVCTNDYSNGTAFFGCIRNLLVYNGTSVSASASTYGAGCTGSAGVPALAPLNNPQFGTNFQLSGSYLPPAPGLALLAIGFSNTVSGLGPLPLDLSVFGFGVGCDLWDSADALTAIGTSGGSATASLAVPNNPALTGFQLFFQLGSLDAGATGGIAMSNGVAATLGF